MFKSIKPALRSILAVVAGYLVLALSNMAFVTLRFVHPTLPLGVVATIAAAALYTFLFSLMGGYLAALIANRSETKHATILAGFMTAVTILSMILAVAIEPLWYKITYLVIMLPATIFGAYVRFTQKAKNAN